MTLPASGYISLNQVNTELGRPATQVVSMNEPELRALANVGGSGTGYWMSSFYSKTKPAITWLGENHGYADNVTALVTGTFSAPRPGLMVVIGLSIGTGTVAINAMTIGGTQSMLSSGPAGTMKCCIGALSVNAGSYQIIYSFTGSCGGSTSHGCAAYLLENLNSTSAVGVNSVASGSAVSAQSMAFNWPTGGVALYGAMINQAGGAPTASWSSVALDYDARDAFAGSPRRYQYGRIATTSLQSPHTETVTPAASAYVNISGASFR